MTTPQKVKNAVAQLDNAMMFHADDLSYASWTAIRAHLLSQEAEIARLADGLMAAEKESQFLRSHRPIARRLAAANALLRFVRTRFDACMDDSDRASIDAHISENTHG